MNEVIGLYGKTWHFWQVDAGNKFPLGKRLPALPCRAAYHLDQVLPA